MEMDDFERHGETESARLNRELAELLQELRVAQGGILILVGFLLVIPFTSRFVEVNQFQRIVYYLAFLFSGAAAVVIIGPVSYHRLVFRRHEKHALLARGHLMVQASLALLAVAILFVLVLVTNFLFGGPLTAVMIVLYVLTVVPLWYGLPMQSRRHAASAQVTPATREAPTH